LQKLAAKCIANPIQTDVDRNSDKFHYAKAAGTSVCSKLDRSNPMHLWLEVAPSIQNAVSGDLDDSWQLEALVTGCFAQMIALVKTEGRGG
jgi:hypothetical protein